MGEELDPHDVGLCEKYGVPEREAAALVKPTWLAAALSTARSE
ncbi:hypothetical protein [Terriglobus sp.]